MPLLPYGRQQIDEDDITAVVEALRSEWLTTGPKIDEFEGLFADKVGARHAVAVSNGTAALHAAVNALGIGPGDEVIVPAITFAATANCVVFERGIPVFADVDPDTLLLDPAAVAGRVTNKTKAVIAVDYAGHPCAYDELEALCRQRDLTLIADACHALGATYRGRPVGSLARLNTFSFHPVKNIATGEGGMITTDESALATSMRRFRNHGFTTDHRQRAEQGAWFSEMVDLGYNYRLTDFQCALGMTQLAKLDGWIARRNELAARYDDAFSGSRSIRPLARRPDIRHAYHLYVIRLAEDLVAHRDGVFQGMRDRGIGVNVHYVPVHLHPFYSRRFDTGPGLCPVAEAAYERILTLPLFPAMTDEDVGRVVHSLFEVGESLS